MPTTIRAALVMLLVLAAGSARADEESPGPVHEVVDSATDGRVTAEVTKLGDLLHRVTVNGHEILLDDLSMGVVLRGIHRAGDRFYVLVERGSGGSACPSVFVAVDASADPPAPSPSFGNCSDLPSVSTSGDALVVIMPDLHGGEDTYEIRGTEVVERHAN